MRIKFFIFLLLITLLFGFSWGSKPWGKFSTSQKPWGADSWGTTPESEVDTYWNTPMTDRWTDAMTVDSLWTTTMNTELP